MKFDKAMYNVWWAMKMRCNNPHHGSYKYYGGKGVFVCKEWADSFKRFVEDMGRRPLGTTIDRIDSNGPYSKANCRWATSSEQNRNKSDNINIEFNGETKCLSAWAEELGVSKASLSYRITKMGMPIHDAMTIPFSKSNSGSHGKFKEGLK